MQDKLLPLCKLYENTSKTTGKRYFVGNLSFTSKLLIFQNEEVKDGEPGWTLFIAEREPKQQPHADAIPDPGEPMRRRRGEGMNTAATSLQRTGFEISSVRGQKCK